MECNELNIQSSQVINTQNSPIIVEHIDDEVPEQEPRNSARTTGDESTQTPMEQNPLLKQLFLEDVRLVHLILEKTKSSS